MKAILNTQEKPNKLIYNSKTVVFKFKLFSLLNNGILVYIIKPSIGRKLLMVTVHHVAYILILKYVSLI